MKVRSAASGFVALTLLGATLSVTVAEAKESTKTVKVKEAATRRGVAKDSVKLGFIWPGTGVASPSAEDSAKACQARVDAQNAKGGVNGRKIQLEAVDDASSGANLTGAQDLVKNRKVFAVVNNSSFAFLSYRYVKDSGVPLIGGGFDGNYYNQTG